MTITLQAVNELIQSLESAGELTIREEKFLKLAKAYADKEAESTAQALTIEKCREITNCPAGVDLQDHLRKLAAENVGLNSYIEAECFVFKCHDVEPIDAMDYKPETPVTDRIVADQRSAFVDEAVAKITESGALTFGDCIVALCQLREGAK